MPTWWQGTIIGAVVQVVRSGRGLLPSGQLLTPEVWERRHRGIVWLLWLHVAGLAAFAVVRYGLHFFVMVGVITLYQDWRPFGLALAYVVVHHTVLGILAPTQVFNHPAAERTPWKWA